MSANRNWCAVCQYAGKARFIAGTFMAPHNAKHHEIEATAGRFLDDLLPSRPKILDLVPGSIWFQADDEGGGER